MDVRCEKCQAEYTLDETLVSPTGTAVRCTSCSHVFRVFAAPPAGAAPQSTWTLRQVSGAVVPFDRMAVLQEWIAKGSVTRDDLLSRGGGEWKRLGDITEMKPFFDAADLAAASGPGVQPVGAGFPPGRTTESHLQTLKVQAYRGEAEEPRPAASVPMARVTTTTPAPAAAPAAAPVARPVAEAPTIRAHSPSLPFAQTAVDMHAMPSTRPAPAAPVIPTSPGLPAVPTAPAAARAPQSREPDLSMSQVPSATEERWQTGRAPHVEGPAWAEKPMHFPAVPPSDYDSEDVPPPKRKVGRWIALAVVLLLVGAGFYVFMYQPGLVRRALGRFVESPDDERCQAFFIKGRESFLLDTENAFVQADREYHKVLALDERHAETLAALAEMYAVWAQYLLDQVYDVRVDAAAAKGASPHLREIARLKSELDHKIADADRWGTQAISVHPEMPAAHLALADVSRLKGNLGAAEDHLAKARSKETENAAVYVAAMVALAKGAPPAEVAESMRRIGHADAEPMLRAQYREARLLAATGKTAEAKEVLAKLLEMNSDHEMARDLSARVDGGQFVALLEADAAAEELRLADAAVPEVVTPPTPPVVQVPAAPSVAGGGAAAGGGGGFGGGAGMDDLDSMLARAAKLQESGNSAGARSLYESVLEVRPNDIDALSGLAYCYLDQGAKGQAIATFRRALAVNPSYGPAMIGLAETYKAQGQKEQALKWYKDYLAKHPSSKYSTLAERNAAEIERALAEAGGTGGASGSPGTDGAESTGPSSGTDPAPAGGGDPAPTPEPSPPAPAPGG
ncbi:MAG: zinc-ribbon domain-containing protein [Proteobacteria bacterium]|jgi:predicted Zn finger-like uncharacterized protein|nr:zinc-ribbon domain-containing protein [Pseudomonadota bacterium]